MWATIISTISYGKEQVDSCEVGISGGASRRLMLALPRCQMIPMRVESSRFIPAV